MFILPAAANKAKLN